MIQIIHDCIILILLNIELKTNISAKVNTVLNLIFIVQGPDYAIVNINHENPNEHCIRYKLT